MLEFFFNIKGKRKKIVSWVTGVLGANINNYKHSNLALLQSAAKGVKLSLIHI